MEIRQDETEYYNVKSKHEYGQFFIRHGSIVKDDGDIRYFGTLSVYSSFGSYGYHWSHAGMPFLEFLKDLEPDYLLGKISRKETCDRTVLKSTRKELAELFHEGSISRNQYAVAAKAVREIEDEGHSAEVMFHFLYECTDLPRDIDIGELRTQAFPVQAVEFVRVLWGPFIEELKGETND